MRVKLKFELKLWQQQKLLLCRTPKEEDAQETLKSLNAQKGKVLK
jgi:hypothetical protein